MPSGPQSDFNLADESRIAYKEKATKEYAQELDAALNYADGFFNEVDSQAELDDMLYSMQPVPLSFEKTKAENLSFTFKPSQKVEAQLVESANIKAADNLTIGFPELKTISENIDSSKLSSISTAGSVLSELNANPSKTLKNMKLEALSEKAPSVKLTASLATKPVLSEVNITQAESIKKKRQEKAAIKIQANWRGKVGRVDANKLRAEKEAHERFETAKSSLENRQDTSERAVSDDALNKHGQKMQAEKQAREQAEREAQKQAEKAAQAKSKIKLSDSQFYNAYSQARATSKRVENRIFKQLQAINDAFYKGANEELNKVLSSHDKETSTFEQFEKLKHAHKILRKCYRELPESSRNKLREESFGKIPRLEMIAESWIEAGKIELTEKEKNASNLDDPIKMVQNNSKLAKDYISLLEAKKQERQQQQAEQQSDKEFTLIGRAKVIRSFNHEYSPLGRVFTGQSLEIKTKRALQEKVAGINQALGLQNKIPIAQDFKTLSEFNNQLDQTILKFAQAGFIDQETANSLISTENVANKLDEIGSSWEAFRESDIVRSIEHYENNGRSVLSSRSKKEYNNVLEQAAAVTENRSRRAELEQDLELVIDAPDIGASEVGAGAPQYGYSQSDIKRVIDNVSGKINIASPPSGTDDAAHTASSSGDAFEDLGGLYDFSAPPLNPTSTSKGVGDYTPPPEPEVEVNSLDLKGLFDEVTGKTPLTGIKEKAVAASEIGDEVARTDKAMGKPAPTVEQQSRPEARSGSPESSRSPESGRSRADSMKKSFQAQQQVHTRATNHGRVRPPDKGKGSGHGR